MKGKENETQCEAAHGPLQPGQRAADSAGQGGLALRQRGVGTVGRRVRTLAESRQDAWRGRRVCCVLCGSVRCRPGAGEGAHEKERERLGDAAECDKIKPL